MKNQTPERPTKHRPFFSIIIPTLNEEKFLPRLLTCLVDQQYSDFEIIIADGGSEDKTMKAAESYEPALQKKQQRLVMMQTPRRNVSFQRNQGATAAKGRYFVFLDADVQIPRDYLLLLHDMIEREKLPFVTTWVEADSADPQDKALALFCNFVFEAATTMQFDFVPGFNVIVRRDLFWKVNGFEEKVVHAEDHHFAHKLKKIGCSLTVVKEPRITVSLRRFRKEGRLTVLRKYTKATLHILLRGPITEQLFEYEMGGRPYRSTTPGERHTLFIQSLKKWQKRLTEYLGDIEKRIDGE